MMARADTPPPCPECGAQYPEPGDSCAQRFDALLALDHSRRESWGSRHGLAFAVFALQHPSRFGGATRDRAFEMLVSVHRRGETLDRVVERFRRASSAAGAAGATQPPTMRAPAHPPHPDFAVTIQDLGAFDEATYAAQLDAWCLATLDVLQPSA